jgi:hypothetical protein
MQHSSEEASVCKIDGDMEKWTSPYGMMHGDVGIWSDNGDLMVTVNLVITRIALSKAAH